MGEKLLAQRVLALLRDTNGRSGYLPQALLDWARDQREWLWPGSGEDLAIDWDSLPGLIRTIDRAGDEPALYGRVEAIGRLMAFDPFEREVLRLAAGLERLPALAACAGG